MFCPICGDEYREGFDRCADCDAALVEEPPEQPETRADDPVTVLETGSQSLIAVAGSLLDAAGIPHVEKNERLQDLFGWGRIGTGFNIAMGPICLQVPRGREREARALLVAMPVIVKEED